MLGRHSFTLPEAVARGELSPYVDPRLRWRRQLKFPYVGFLFRYCPYPEYP